MKPRQTVPIVLAALCLGAAGGVVAAASDSVPLPRERPAAVASAPTPPAKPQAAAQTVASADEPQPRAKPAPPAPPVPEEKPQDAAASEAAGAPPLPAAKPAGDAPLPLDRPAGETPVPQARPAEAAGAAPATPLPEQRPADAAPPVPEEKPQGAGADAAPLPAEKPAEPMPAAAPEPVPPVKPEEPSTAAGEGADDGAAAPAPAAPVPVPPRPPLFSADAMSPACDAIEEGRVSGRPLKPIEDPAGCVVPEVYAISSVGSERAVELTPGATLTCALADRFDRFVEEVAEPAARDILKSELTGLRIAGSYVCRTRNGQPGADPSEHGKANAIDIAGFVLADGRTVTVTESWADEGEAGQFLRAVHDKACGPFTTVIGPDGDAYHRDHFHLDLQPRGAGGQTTFCQ